MPSCNFEVPEHYDEFIRDGIAAGRFTDTNAALIEGLQLLEEREKEYREKLKWLKRAAKVGFDQLDRGEGIKFESMEEFEAYFDRLVEEVTSDVLVRQKRG